MLESVKNTFQQEDIQNQYSVIGYGIELYFHKYKIAVEVSEYGHNDRDSDYEKQREERLTERLACVFIRINPDEQNFNIFKTINEIYRHIKRSSKKYIKDRASQILFKTKLKKTT